MNKIMLHCTDKDVKVEAHVLNHKSRLFLEAAINTVKVRLTYHPQTKVYVGSMAGLEFVIREEDVPREHTKEWSR